MVPAIGRIRNYEKVKFTVTMNKSIDIFWLQIEGLHWRQSIIHILWNISHDSWYILHKQVFIEYRIRKPVSRLVSENIRHDSLHFTFIISDFSSHVHLWNVDFAQ